MNKFILLLTLFWIFISSDAYRLKRNIGLTPPKNCNENEIWNPCGGCEKTCADPNVSDYLFFPIFIILYLANLSKNMRCRKMQM